MKADRLLLIALLTTVALSSVGFAQEKSEQNDKTGTNPIDFQRELRFNNEYLWLNTLGDGTQNLTTAEFKTPFAGGKWQWRVRTRFNMLKADLDNDGVNDVDESGLGDTDMRFITIPYVNMAKKQAVAVGVEVFFDTASEDALGSGTTALGPQVFYVKFLPRGLFAPGLQYKVSVDEAAGRSDIDQILIDLNYLRMSKNKQSWFFTDPQIVIDNETNQVFMIVDFEFGFMMSKWTKLQGQSFYIRPSFGLGSDRPTDGSLEIGYKIIGF